MIEATRVCSSCGQKLRKLNAHHVNKQTVMVLEMIAKLNDAGHEWVRVEAGHMLRAEFQTVRTAYRAGAYAIYLTWFGLLEDRARRSGEFRVTHRGFNFLIGRTPVPMTIYCQGGSVIETAKEHVYIHEVRDIAFDKAYWDHYAEQQKYPDRAIGAIGLLF